MTRSLKSFGLIVGVLLMLCGLMAQAASAHTPAKFTSAQSTTTVTGVGEEGGATFTVTGRTVTCTTEEFHAHGVGTSVEQLTVTPTYTGCTAFGFAGAKVTGFGHYGESETCDYVLKANGTADLACPAGRDVTVEVGTTCISHVPAQSNLGTITYVNKSNLRTTDEAETIHNVDSVTMEINLTGITVTHTDLNFLCPFSGSGEVSNATLSGKATAWGEDPETGNLVGITWDATVA